jgi:hypothetical protein
VDSFGREKLSLELFAISLYNINYKIYAVRGADMDFDWITPQQAAERWGITERRVQALCANGQVEGVIRLKGGWFIPKDSLKPADGRRNNGRKPTENNRE